MKKLGLLAILLGIALIMGCAKEEQAPPTDTQGVEAPADEGAGEATEEGGAPAGEEAAPAGDAAEGGDAAAGEGAGEAPAAPAEGEQ